MTEGKNGSAPEKEKGSLPEDGDRGLGDRPWDQLPIRPLPCPHRHFAVSRDQLAPQEYLNLHSTPRGSRWPAAEFTGRKCHPLAAQAAKRKRKSLVRPPEQQYASEFLSEILRLLSTHSTKKILVDEYGLSNEEAETITKELKKRKKSVSVLNQDVRATWLNEYKRLMKAKLTDYVFAVMSSRRSKRTRYIASTLLNHISDLTGERCNLNNPQNRVQRIQVFVADRLASWLANIMAETDKEMCKDYFEKSVNEFDFEAEEPKKRALPRPGDRKQKELEEKKRQKELLEEEKRKKLEEQRRREEEKKRLQEEKLQRLKEQRQKDNERRRQERLRKKEEAERLLKEKKEKARQEEEEKRNREREIKIKEEQETKKREQLRIQRMKEQAEKTKRDEAEMRRKSEVRRKKIEEENKKAEEARRIKEEEEKRKREEETRRRQEEMKKREEEKRRKEEENRLREQKRKEEEEKRKNEEELRKEQEEAARRKKLEEERKKKEEEEAKKRKEEEERKIKQEEEERKRKEEEERKRKEEEERKRMEEEERERMEEEERERMEEEGEGAGDTRLTKYSTRDPLDEVGSWVRITQFEEIPDSDQVASDLEDEIRDAIEGQLSLIEEELITDTSKAYAKWVVKELQEAYEEANRESLSKVTYHISKDEGKCYYDVRKVDDIKVCDMTKVARYERVAVISESICKRPSHLGELKTAEDMKEWAQWASNVVDLAAKWAVWIDETCNEAEANVSSGQQKEEGQDWGQFKRSAESRALELRRIKKYITETAKMWDKKFKGNP